ncbi:PAS domain S-box protein [Nostoc sp. FACHB-152]|uniref:PAS domain-containing hybrid sensor histidine kinase/response regulator n=1 Tax=unclassified Nostoc TaxID=2593658 RepID=UPI001684B67B|nr:MULTISPECIES: PAS domain S-box protein [unclassified Nostoc]MBD2447200.1 PAS domain S-box protein [Nostoc sp. FACHB-152]MBD2471859.1 PAS domain S-box protein [Nostoc sp. FACHB-145]
MKRDSTGKFVSNWESEAKQRFSVTLTATAWQLLEQEAQKQGISRSELVEQVARSFAQPTVTHKDHRETTPEAESKLVAALESISEKRFRRLVESNMFGVAFGNFTGGIHYANDYFLNMVGYNREDLLSGNIQWMQMTPPEFLPLDAKAIEELRTTGIATPFEKEYIRKDGTRVPILIGSVLLQEPYDQQQEIIGFFLDLTQRKQAEVGWREGRQILDAIMEYIPEGITIADAPDVTIRRVSKYGQELIGRSPDIIEGIPASQHPEKWGFFCADGITRPTPEELPLTRAVKHGEVVTDEEWVIQRPNGEKISILCNAGPILNQDGQRRGGVIAWRDITERKQAEEKLRQALQRLNFHVDNTPMGVIEWDRDFRVIRWSEAAERILGWTADEAVGKLLTELRFVFEEDAEAVGKACERLVIGEETQVFSYNRNYRKDGSIVHCEWYNSSLKDEFGRMNSVLSLILDVTDRKQAEAERERLLQQEQAARAEAEQANRIKDEFLAVLSHELRTPLNPILGWSRLLQTQKLNPAKITEALNTIERNAKLQAQLIEDLLDVSRILQGKLNLNVTPVDLTSVISGAMETVLLAAEAKSIKIQTMLASNVGEVAGDSSRLQQVVWNLLSNAIKFTPTGGQVEIKLERFDSMAQIKVSDTGKGISLEFLPYVFDYFRQADSTTTRKFGGLGLGLAIVRNLVELHGGTVFADSPGEGRGATFTVRLPLMLTQSPTNQDGRKMEQALDLNGIKVLVVDDDADSREFVAFVLEQEGANVAMAGSAIEALAALSQFQPNILLSDIGMPQIDGYMLLQQVRKLPPEKGGNIPAIALTAYAGEINEKQAITAGFQKHISKPVEPDDLVTVIAQLLTN